MSTSDTEIVISGQRIMKIDFSDTEAVEQEILSFDALLSIHAKIIFSPSIVNSITCFNLHPGFLPFNRGIFPQVFSILNGYPCGATLHLIDESIDAGRIIDRREVAIEAIDTSFDVYKKIIAVEMQILEENLENLISGEFKFIDEERVGNYNSLNDFSELCNLDLVGDGTMRQHLNLLIALTHDGFKNSYFHDASGNKIYVEIKLSITP
jgi:methionyl-tRNA formyltransferase